ncbi:MAG: hypothetical protein IV100_06045 [Myxococcales bacterium]|nr:hypothetical protein [Myxococcales bacterium]
MTQVATRLILLASFALAPVADAFEAPLHEQVTRAALVGSPLLPAADVPALRRGAHDAFRRWFFVQIQTVADPALRARFLKRYPDARAFDARAFRELVGLTSARARNVPGFDSVRMSSPTSAPELLLKAAAAPELDLRHRDRVLQGPTGETPRGSDGKGIPVDPADTNAAPATGAASDTAAFLAFPVQPDGTLPPVTPVRYDCGAACATTGLGARGPAFAGRFTDLSLLAAAWPEGGAGGQAKGALALEFAGAAMHYLQKAASPLWTRQFGHATFTDYVARQYAWRAFVSAGGRIGPLRATGISTEALQRNLRRIVDRRAVEVSSVTALTADPDALLALRLRSNELQQPSRSFATALAFAAAASADHDADAVFEAALVATCGRVKLDGFVFHDPRASVAAPTSTVFCDVESERVTKALAAMDELNQGALRRAVAVTRLYSEQLAQALSAGVATEASASALNRIVRDGLDELDAADTRRAEWQSGAARPEQVTDTTWLVIDLILVAVIAIGVAWIVRRSPALRVGRVAPVAAS